MRRSMFANTTRILLTAGLALTTCVSLQLAVAQDDAARNVDKTNYVSKFTSTSGALTDSLIFDNGTNVGIGTTTPATHLHISAADTAANGNRSAIRISNTASTNDRDWWLRVGAPGTNTPDGGFSLGDDDAYWFVITFNGNVGMGLNVTSPTHPLQMADGANEDNGTWNNDSDRNLRRTLLQSTAHNCWPRSTPCPSRPGISRRAKMFATWARQRKTSTLLLV